MTPASNSLLSRLPAPTFPAGAVSELASSRAATASRTTPAASSRSADVARSERAQPSRGGAGGVGLETGKGRTATLFPADARPFSDRLRAEVKRSKPAEEPSRDAQKSSASDTDDRRTVAEHSESKTPEKPNTPAKSARSERAKSARTQPYGADSAQDEAAAPAASEADENGRTSATPADETSDANAPGDGRLAPDLSKEATPDSSAAAAADTTTPAEALNLFATVSVPAQPLDQSGGDGLASSVSATCTESEASASVPADVGSPAQSLEVDRAGGEQPAGPGDKPAKQSAAESNVSSALVPSPAFGAPTQATTAARSAAETEQSSPSGSTDKAAAQQDAAAGPARQTAPAEQRTDFAQLFASAAEARSGAATPHAPGSLAGASPDAPHLASAQPLSPEVRFAQTNTSNIVQSVRGQLLPDGGNLTLRLDPPEIGQLQVQLTMKDGLASVTFATDNADTARLMTHTLSELRDGLTTAGVNVDRLVVQQAPPSPRQDSSADSKSSGQNAGQGADREGAPWGGATDQNARRDQNRRDVLERLWRRAAGEDVNLVA